MAKPPYDVIILYSFIGIMARRKRESLFALLK